MESVLLRSGPGPDSDMEVSNNVMELSKKPYEWCPPYSTDIDTAMEVLAKLQERGKTISLRWWPPDEVPGNPEGLWTCHIGLGRTDAKGDTLSHAICKAAVANGYDV